MRTIHAPKTRLQLRYRRHLRVRRKVSGTAERPRLVGIASRVLGDHAEAQDVVQQAWLRLHATDAEIETLPAWLTTVTTRLCLDRLRSRTPVPTDDVEPDQIVNDPADDVALADTSGWLCRSCSTG